MTELLLPKEIEQMRQHLTANPPLVGPPEGREYWDAYRIVTTLETYYYALMRIASYETPDQLKEDDYGLGYEEALEMAYENIQTEAKAVLFPKAA